MAYAYKTDVSCYNGETFQNSLFFVRLQMHIKEEALHLHMCRNPWIFEFMKPRVAAKHLQFLRSLRVNEDSGSCHVNKPAVEDQRTSPVHIGNKFLWDSAGTTPPISHSLQLTVACSKLNDSYAFILNNELKFCWLKYI